eukprot:CAMPEP_0204380158 /NCGR_PEP_ID=MMETSP0469-20131031/53159_1 /ASSEMBLY_ACC=CAM_ASM_000384 /TAXON_ID=2969 /ORGANISM="Oxyrrhis marina" /LENGTH=678 /DNA_ID=CAMNT_0051371747 /DNA_START=175 /DNA_END=2214 /DNA_ORIENTATION=+
MTSISGTPSGPVSQLRSLSVFALISASWMKWPSPDCSGCKLGLVQAEGLGGTAAAGVPAGFVGRTLIELGLATGVRRGVAVALLVEGPAGRMLDTDAGPRDHITQHRGLSHRAGHAVIRSIARLRAGPIRKLGAGRAGVMARDVAHRTSEPRLTRDDLELEPGPVGQVQSREVRLALACQIVLELQLSTSRELHVADHNVLLRGVPLPQLPRHRRQGPRVLDHHLHVVPADPRLLGAPHHAALRTLVLTLVPPLPQRAEHALPKSVTRAVEALRRALPTLPEPVPAGDVGSGDRPGGGVHLRPGVLQVAPAVLPEGEVGAARGGVAPLLAGPGGLLDGAVLPPHIHGAVLLLGDEALLRVDFALAGGEEPGEALGGVPVFALAPALGLARAGSGAGVSPPPGVAPALAPAVCHVTEVVNTSLCTLVRAFGSPPAPLAGVAIPVLALARRRGALGAVLGAGVAAANSPVVLCARRRASTCREQGPIDDLVYLQAVRAPSRAQQGALRAIEPRLTSTEACPVTVALALRGVLALGAAVFLAVKTPLASVAGLTFPTLIQAALITVPVRDPIAQVLVALLLLAALRAKIQQTIAREIAAPLAGGVALQDAAVAPETVVVAVAGHNPPYFQLYSLQTARSRTSGSAQFWSIASASARLEAGASPISFTPITTAKEEARTLMA